jgi:hypothetical protein
MKTIIINGQRELAELPELWYTDGTEKVKEWAVAMRKEISQDWLFYAPNKSGAIGHDDEAYCIGTYITPSEFNRLVYQPWKDGQKVELPTNYEELIDILIKGKTSITWHPHGMLPHIQACIQLTNIMNFANDAFEGDGNIWQADAIGEVSSIVPEWCTHPIRFTSKAAAEWAYQTFPEIFKAYWNV